MTAHFSNCVLIVTGAASGIGRHVALQAARHGALVIAADINNLALAETKSIGIDEGLQMEVHELDVADKKAINDFAKMIIPQLKGRKLILVNNAGVGLFSGSFNNTDQDDFEWLININLWGVIRMTKAFYPYFMQHNNGHIVNLSSVFGLGGFANQTAYCTAKFGVRGFTEALRMELVGTGIYTTCVHPGGIKTNIMRAATPKGAGLTADMHVKAIADFEKIAMTTPEKAAELILEAVKRKQPRLVIGKDGRVIDMVTRLLPVAYTKIFKKKVDKALKVGL
ncbi:SDR family oxidoreductase [Segetibacter sp.]|jgi:NAD(P)-dependent dehydrogenase (short-subunit alcohol dehydrogenase family)|uniref:SDR family NAD(P)-dependent oxidoreductase n=1 Tax=Segetibacter sp. TaxID=2231182 RepID=UPI002638DC95|nr:SDR family oxidoreductase [Segetibacter sp.]MCW3080124.1 short-chain dehydrogenase [Segetibacter sp.]